MYINYLILLYLNAVDLIFYYNYPCTTCMGCLSLFENLLLLAIIILLSLFFCLCLIANNGCIAFRIIHPKLRSCQGIRLDRIGSSFDHWSLCSWKGQESINHRRGLELYFPPFLYFSWDLGIRICQHARVQDTWQMILFSFLLLDQHI